MNRSASWKTGPAVSPPWQSRPSNKHILTGSRDNNARVFDIETGQSPIVGYGHHRVGRCVVARWQVCFDGSQDRTAGYGTWRQALVCGGSPVTTTARLAEWPCHRTADCGNRQLRWNHAALAHRAVATRERYLRTSAAATLRQLSASPTRSPTSARGRICSERDLPRARDSKSNDPDRPRTL